MLTSYAQNFEDVMLWRALGHVEQGFYIDIGAQHPVEESVSLAFYEKGWRGVHVEPTPAYAQALREARPDEIVVQAAVGNEAELIPFFEIPGTGISTGIEDIATRHEGAGFAPSRIEVPCIRLSSLLDRHEGRDIHWMKIDVEGMERSVLQSWAPSSVRPWVVVVESTLPLTQELSHDSWEAIVLELGYRFVYFDGLNRFYVSTAHEELVKAFETPLNLFDQFVLTERSPFCGRQNAAVWEANAQIRQLQTQQAELQQALAQAKQNESATNRVVELEQRLTEQALEARKATDDALSQAQQIERLLQQISSTDTTHAAQAVSKQTEHDRVAHRLAECEQRLVEAREQALTAQAEAAALRNSLTQQHAFMQAHLNERTSALDLAIRAQTEAFGRELEAARAQAQATTAERLREEFQAELRDQRHALTQAFDKAIQDLQNGESGRTTAAQADHARELEAWREQSARKELRLTEELACAREDVNRLQMLIAEPAEFHSRFESLSLEKGQLEERAAVANARLQEAASDVAILKGQREELIQHYDSLCARYEGLRRSEASLRSMLDDTTRARAALEHSLANKGIFGPGNADRIVQAGSLAEKVKVDIAGRLLTDHDQFASDTLLVPACAGSALAQTNPPSENTLAHPAAASVVGLLALFDASFVKQAYQTLLGREPDPLGFESYLTRVRQGTAREVILLEIATSNEADLSAKHTAIVNQLQQRVERNRPKATRRAWARLTGASDDMAAQHLRAVENRLASLISRLSSQTSEIRWALACMGSALFNPERLPEQDFASENQPHHTIETRRPPESASDSR